MAGRIAVGIDLGTSNCLTAFVNAAGNTEIVTDEVGHRLVPSVVLFDDDRTVVGEEALLLGRTRRDRLALGIKRELGLAVTLSLGERSEEDLRAWREAGADRYLMRFETSDPELYRLIHPSLPNRPSDRMALLRTIQALGYEAGSGVMIGIPGQTYEVLANDIATFAEMDLDMIGVGPYLAHPATPLGAGEWRRAVRPDEQVPNTELMVYKTIALTRLVCPDSNIPSTTALATLNRDQGRELGLMRGANVVMPNLTPTRYRALYEIYPDKACIFDTAASCQLCLHGRILSLGREIGAGPGERPRKEHA